MPERLKPMSGISRVLHYGLVLLALTAWADAVWPVAVPRDWLDHRFLGSVTGSFVVLGWLRRIREGASRPSRQPSARSAVLAVATVVTLTGLPSLYRLDGVFQPADWVLWSRRIHAVAAHILAAICAVELIGLALGGLDRLDTDQLQGFRFARSAAAATSPAPPGRRAGPGRSVRCADPPRPRRKGP